MTAYRRNFVPGGCFFFTVNLAVEKRWVSQGLIPSYEF